MSHYENKAPLLLAQLAQGKSLMQACKDVGISAPSTVYRWIVASRSNKLDQTTFMETTLPFHLAYEAALSLAVKVAEQQIISTVAQGGRWVPCYKDGEQTFQRLSPREMLSAGTQLEIELGLRSPTDDFAYDADGKRIAQLQFIKSDAATNLRVLEAWNRRYKPTSEHTVNVQHGVLRLPREGQTDSIPPKPVMDVQSTEVFSDDADASEVQRPRLALAAPCKTSEEFDALVAAGAFEVERPKPPDSDKPTEPTAPKPSNPLRDPSRPLQGETHFMQPQAQRGTTINGHFIPLGVDGYPCAPERKPNRDPHDPRRGPPGHASGNEQHKGFKVV